VPPGTVRCRKTILTGRLAGDREGGGVFVAEHGRRRFIPASVSAARQEVPTDVAEASARRSQPMIRKPVAQALVAAALAMAAPAFAQEGEGSWLPSLITDTPEQGFDLAVSMARKAVTTTQPDVDTLHKLRPAYAHDPDSLIDVSGVVASYFATIAEASDYWRE
jgi:hypothetical protein